MRSHDPRVIQGGMGVGVSNWSLANAVAAAGQLGVVSGTALDTVLVRRLQRGDVGGHVRRAMAAFPFPDIARATADRYLRTGVDAQRSEFKLLALPNARMTAEREDLLVLANFVEVFLAKEGHSGPVGINYLYKIQLPLLPSLYGAMLAGVSYVLMGAGIPTDVPEALDHLSEHQESSLPLDVEGAGDERFTLKFDPSRYGLESLGPALRPRFLPIVASATLARALLKKARGAIHGFIVEGPIAGGHNAPPRGELKLSERGEPIYGERDVVNPEHMRALEVPFWLAGAYASREKFLAALEQGAHGVQLGTAFAFCEESGIESALKQRFLQSVLHGNAGVYTDPCASPTGYPFKVACLDGTMSCESEYQRRPRICDVGYLRQPYRKADGTLGYRCASEPVDDYCRKGGNLEETRGRKCLCNALLTNIGLGQTHPNGFAELPMLTAGDDLACLKELVTSDRPTYHARDVLALVLNEQCAPAPR